MTNIYIQIINSSERIHDITEQEFDAFYADISQISAGQKQFVIEKINLEKEKIKKEQIKDWVNTIDKITHYVGYSFSIVIGGTILPTNPILGACAIAGGSIGFINSLLKDTKALEKITSLITKNTKYQKYINGGIEAAGTLSSLALSSAALIINPTTVTIFGNISKIKEVGETLLLISKSVSNAAHNVMKADVQNYEQKILFIEKKQFHLSFVLNNTQEDLKTLFSQNQRIGEVVSSMFKNKE
ncbi:MAG: hypothetical protein AMS24_03830 [Chlamydiae bacterium SM23_39]|nr:MAG: hypothetical protein AMS24_03830 [Chlamydiae bacterium SM23_39]